MSPLRAVILGLLSLPLLSASPPLAPHSPLPYSLLRLVEFKATDELVERDLALSATPNDGLNSTQSCLGYVDSKVGGAFLCSAKSLFESQFEPRTKLIGSESFDAIRQSLSNVSSTDFPCNHGDPENRDNPSFPSAEVIIALKDGFLLYGCHNYISLALQKPQNSLLSNFAMLKAYKVPHTLIQPRECKGPEADHPPCTLTVVKHEGTLVAEDYVCCCNSSRCAAVIVDQGGWLSPLPLLRFNVELDTELKDGIDGMIYTWEGGKYTIGGNVTSRRRRFFTNLRFAIWDNLMVCMIFFIIIGAMSLLTCFQVFCKDTIVNDA
ncbi:hypothetical protein PENTCL1PPCAC_10959 [Pristionchus entomophagus]|uniref:Uncharacterized protein n=1 Tax=Pristionchus entomophagus TaxID=358040 RepID=A0AAV5T593_9BILA|nr:hypothetical protein PENTCL1PPCAC_10959 [Pristionchus entomophagus]